MLVAQLTDAPAGSRPVKPTTVAAAPREEGVMMIRRLGIYAAAGVMAVLAIALVACSRETVKEVPVTEVVTETVVKEVPVVVEKEVVREVEVPVEVVVEKEVVREVEVPVEVVVEKEVVREVEVPVEVVVEKEVVREVEVEVVREVSVPGETVVVEKEVVKEVPVVVEKDVVREIEAMVEAESAESDSAAPASGSPSPERRRSRPNPVTLSAGEVDDNERWGEYLRYRSSYAGPRVHDVDVSERYVISVRDSRGRPVPNAIVRVSADQTTIFEGRTYANGQSLFFPRAFPQASNVSAFRLHVEKDGVSQYLDTTRRQGNEWVVKLDVDRSNSRRVPLDVLFLLDSTGSMADEIDQVKDTLLSISERIHNLPSRPDLRFGMVTYRDRGDDYVTLTFDFDRDVQQFLNTIQGVHADGGGDYPESVNEALHEAVHGPSWRLGDAIRLVFMIADAPPHLDYSQDNDYAEEMIEAHRRGIKIFTIASSGLDDQGEYVFRQISQHTMGRFIFIVYGAGGATPHHVSQYTIQQLDDLVVRLVQEEMAHLVDGQAQTSRRR